MIGDSTKVALLLYHPGSAPEDCSGYSVASVISASCRVKGIAAMIDLHRSWSHRTRASLILPWYFSRALYAIRVVIVLESYRNICEALTDVLRNNMPDHKVGLRLPFRSRVMTWMVYDIYPAFPFFAFKCISWLGGDRIFIFEQTFFLWEWSLSLLNMSVI